jgi:hypothetical protein
MKKDVKRKSSPASWKPRKILASSPLVTVQASSRRVARAWSDRSETVSEEGKEGRRLDSVSEAQQAKRLRGTCGNHSSIFTKIDSPAAGNDPEGGIGSRYTLKLLVVSILPDRSFLLACDFLSVADRLPGGRRELKAEIFSSGRQTFDPILSESLFVFLRTLIHVRLRPPEQAVNYSI